MPLITSHVELLSQQPDNQSPNNILHAINQMFIGAQMHHDINSLQELPDKATIEYAKTQYTELLLSKYSSNKKTSAYYEGLILTGNPIVYSQGVHDIIDSKLSNDDKALLITSAMQQQDKQIEVLDILFLKQQQGIDISLYTNTLKNMISFNPQLLQEHADQLLNEIEASP